ncbi:unnamed protein product [Arabidopsis halleri]
MFFSWLSHKPADNTDCMCKIWSCTNHSIHQTSHSISIRNPRHILFFLFRLISKHGEMNISSKWSVNRLC